MATITDVWTPQTPAGAVAYRTAACLDDGSVAIIRLLEPTDEMLLRAFQNALPERSFERRCFHEMKLERGLDHRQLATEL